MSVEELPAHLAQVHAAVTGGIAELRTVPFEELARLGADLRVATSAYSQLGPGPEVRIDRRSMPAARRCPASAVGSFGGWTPLFAARILGARAAELAVREREGVGPAVARVIDEVVAEGRGLGQWLGEQSRPVRAATTATAATWAARALVSVPWAVLGHPRFDRREWYRPHGRGTRLVLAGRADAVLTASRSRPGDRVLVTLAGEAADFAGLDVLVFALQVNRAPIRHVTVDPSSGQVSVFDVDIDVLRHAVDEVAAAAEVLLPLAGGDHLPTSPGPHCRWCDRQADCEPGAAWLGLPSPAAPETGRQVRAVT